LKHQEETLLSADTVIGSAVKVKGDLISKGNISIYGSVDGQVTTAGDVLIGDSAKLSASLAAQNAQISGIVKGNVTVSGLLKITSSGVVQGDISAQTLEIEPGAQFTGKCSMPKEKIEKLEKTENS
jgi:cytoskeletal protein CcmA (bactofilin family)